MLAAERQKRMRADSEHQQRMAMEVRPQRIARIISFARQVLTCYLHLAHLQTDQKKREKMAAQEKRERKTNKHLVRCNPFDLHNPLFRALC